MKIVYSSSFLNAHLLGICEKICKDPNVSHFSFIENSEQSQDRKSQGFEEISQKYDFVVKASQDPQRARQEMLDADVLIFSSGREDVLKQRMDENKLTFRCSERFFKLGLWRRFIPSSYQKKKQHFLRYKDKNFYYLCMGAYVPFDLKFSGFPVEKCFQWAYLPEIIEMKREQIEEKQQTQEKLSICWAARMIGVKHPERALQIALKLKQRNVPFELTMMGGGPLLEKIKKMVQQHHLENDVKVLGNCLPKDTQKIMKQSQVFLFTSDYWEGWGAVLNESMGLGCIPVSSTKAGSTTVLVKDSQNGFWFKSVEDAVSAIEKLAQSEPLRMTMAQNAYSTICEQWSAEVAAQRFIAVSKALLAGDGPVLYPEGPMSKVVVRKPKNYIYTDF